MIFFTVSFSRFAPSRKKCTVSLRERQFATLYLFHAYTGWGGGKSQYLGSCGHPPPPNNALFFMERKKTDKEKSHKGI